MECRNGKFFQKSHRNGKVDAFLERKEENQAEWVWKAGRLPWKWDRAMRLSQSSLTVTVQRKESLRLMPRTITPYRGVISESRWGMSSAASHPDKVPEPFPNLFDTLFA